MHTSSQVKTFPPAEMSRWALGPSHSRVESIDLSLRERLGKSLDYVVQVSRERDNAELVGLDNLQRRLKRGTRISLGILPLLKAGSRAFKAASRRRCRRFL